jgi:hypothetical protein
MRNLILVTTIVLSTLGNSASAQQPPASSKAAVTEPGKASAAAMAEITAQVVGIDKATRTVTLKGPKGNVVDVVAGDEVKNFDQLRVGDTVVARYAGALSLQLVKTKGRASERTETTDITRAQPGERPGGTIARQVTVLADVIAVDQNKKTITLKGPKGNVVTLDVQNPEHLKVVKKGDQIEAHYTEAVALSVEPKPPAKKQSRP